MDLARKGMFQRILVFILLSGLFSGNLFAQASWEKFGQNRMQFRVFSWKYYDSVHFRCFYYDYGKANAMYALTVAEQELSHIVYMMGGRLNKKLNLVLYNSFGDFRQTNIGRKNDEINQANGGKVDVAGDQLPIYFDGDHHQLKQQIRKGIARVIKDNMLFGDNLKDVVRNAVQMNLPEWYTLGYVNFIASEWTGIQQTELLNQIVLSDFKKFQDYALQQPVLFGHSFWQFISSRYGENYISNLLYLTRYRKSVSQALETVFRKPSAEIFTEWKNFYSVANSSLIAADTPSYRQLLTQIAVKPGATYHQMTASPSGREIAYVEKKDGKFTIWIRDVLYNKSYPIIEGGMRGLADLADPDYPMLCWSPSGKRMAALYQHKHVLNLRIFTTGKRIMEKRSISPRKMDRITGMCFMGDENTLAVTGIRKGQSDLYLLTIRNNRFEQITNDLFDEKSPQFIQNAGDQGVLFLSNRNTRFINQNRTSNRFHPSFNVYQYSPSKGNILNQLSNSQGKLHSPIQWGLEQYSFLEDIHGRMRRFLVEPSKTRQGSDTLISHPAMPAPFPVLSQEYLLTKARVIEYTRNKNMYQVYQSPIDSLLASQKKYDSKQPVDQNLPVEETDTIENILGYITPFDDEPVVNDRLEQIFKNTRQIASRYQLFDTLDVVQKPKLYRTTFYPDFVQTTLDNTLLFTRYQPLSTQFNNIGLNGFLTSTLTDIMEDYKITGGARLGFNLRSIDYFLQFSNFRRRVDWELIYVHSGSAEETAPPAPYYSPFTVLGRRGMDLIQGQIIYPFSMTKSVRLQTGIRYDRTRYLAREQYSIVIPSSRMYWSVSRLEFVYDNTINPMMNIWKGGRAKLFVEYQYQLNSPVKGFTNIGYDIRHYMTIYKNMIFASRFAGAHSMGKAKVLYFLGGVDNPIIPSFDQNTVINIDQDYAFQTLATNLRGYRQGARNGSSFMVLNEEIRLPLYQTFFKKQVKSGFVRNLQLVAFADAGVGIKGIFPNAENIVNQIQIREPGSNVTVLMNREAALGYGLGIRTRLLGYFLRADVAWNVESNARPMLHLSLATDF